MGMDSNIGALYEYQGIIHLMCGLSLYGSAWFMSDQYGSSWIIAGHFETARMLAGLYGNA